MTNHHVISGCDKIKIILSNKKELSATVRGSEAYSDIAVLTVDSKDAPSVAVLGKSDKTRVGDTLFAIGSPEGADYAGTVTKGILSGKNRMIAVALSNSNTSDYYMKVLQTDAAINPGNSGGALLNSKGELIGINSVKFISEDVEGMGYAIPISDVESIIGNLMNKETRDKVDDAQKGYLGISNMVDVTDDVSKNYNMPVGVYVKTVLEGLGSDKAGMQDGDIITSVDGTTVSTSDQLREMMSYYSAGETIEVKVQRLNGNAYEEQTLQVTLSTQDETTAQSQIQNKQEK
mgnify:CR=1 FL=1